MRDRIGKSLRFVALLKKKGHDVTVTEADAKADYDKNVARFAREEQVQASHILLKVEPGADAAKTAEVEKRAKELAALAKAPGADFAALAKEHSEGPSAPGGGDLGLFEKSKMVPPFANAAWTMKIGEISDPVKTRFGFHVIKVTARKAGGQTPFSEAKDQIIAQLENDKRREASQTVVGELTAAAKVERLPENIKVNAGPTSAPTLRPPGPGLGLGLPKLAPKTP